MVKFILIIFISTLLLADDSAEIIRLHCKEVSSIFKSKRVYDHSYNSCIKEITAKKLSLKELQSYFISLDNSKKQRKVNILKNRKIQAGIRKKKEDIERKEKERQACAEIYDYCKQEYIKITQKLSRYEYGIIYNRHYSKLHTLHSVYVSAGNTNLWIKNEKKTEYVTYENGFSEMVQSLTECPLYLIKTHKKACEIYYRK